MLTAGDVLEFDLGLRVGREAGFRHPCVVVTAQGILDGNPRVVHVVPLTTTVRGFSSEIIVEPDASNGLDAVSAAQCQHVRAVSVDRLESALGNVGPATLAHMREVIGLILDIGS